jgi:hypothetical protein
MIVPTNKIAKKPEMIVPTNYGLWAEAMEPELRRLLGEKTP